jgi:hypothetical protein
MKWTLKPPCEAQVALEELIKSGQINVDTEPKEAIKMHASFKAHKPANFRLHLSATRSRLGSYCTCICALHREIVLTVYL